jgi:lambda family phage minor tail protein L
MTSPASHVEESIKLEADGLVDLFEVYIKGTSTVVYFTNHPTVTWQGHEYDQIPSKMGGDRRSADPEESRPTLQIQDIGGVFTPYIVAKTLDYATLVRRRILRQHLEANLAIAETRMWLIARPKELVPKQTAVFELRNMTEGANFMIPARMFVPPEFPFIRL